jgi:putative nucleotidyltransferase with HDIG domain
MLDTKEAANKLQQTIGRISNLPTPPLVFQQINRVINDPGTSAYDIAAILSEDPAISVKILKLSNSAFYGLRHEVTSIKQAVVIMGMEAVRSMVLSTAVFDIFKKDAIGPEIQERFWRHSLATATCMRMLVRSLSGTWITKSDQAFSTGLLHDIGRLVMCSYLPGDFRASMRLHEADGLSLLMAEETALGYTHSDVGALLAQKWGLPRQLKDAIEFHHYPHLSEAESSLAYMTHLADYIAHLTLDTEVELEEDPPHFDPVALEELNIPDDHLESYSDTLREEYTKAETFIQMATGM